MAVLSKIRQRSLLLILVIGFCLLAFIIGDIFASGGIGMTSREVGSINGKDISFEEFSVKVSNLTSSQQGMTNTQAANNIWEQEIAIALLSDEFDKLGIRVGESHILEAFKSDPQIGQQPMFMNEAGVFDVNKFREFAATNPEQAQFIRNKEKEVALNSRFTIYNTLIRAGIFVTDAEAKLMHEAEASRVSFDYVQVPFSSVKDSDVTVTDAEITEYMKKHSKKFKADENREVEFVQVVEQPSAEDEAEVKQRMNSFLAPRVEYNQAKGANDTLPSFAQVADVADFVNRNSEVAFDSTYVSKSDLPTAHADALYNLNAGEVYGPYMFGDYICVSRSMGRKAGARAKASHVLLGYDGTPVPNMREMRTKEEARAKAEQLLAEAKANPAGFTMLAVANSDDSSAQRGGDLGFFSPGQMVVPFNDYVFNNPIGSIGLVETQFGYHIIQITDKQDGIRLATIAQKLEPSETTMDANYQTAVNIEMEADNTDLATAAKAQNLTVNSARVRAMDEQFGTLGNQRAIVQWAFDRKTSDGDVKRFELPNVGQVVARLKKVNKEGLLSIEEARPMVEPILKNRKKAELIKAKLKGGDLASMAKAAGVEVQSASDVTLQNNMLPNAGPEPKVVGTAFATATGKVSAPVEGNSGVYVVSTKSLAKAPELATYTDQVQRLKAQRGQFSSRVLPALKENADIKDDRRKFNY